MAVTRFKKGDPKRRGWADALLPAKLTLERSYSDVILYDAQGKRIGVMDGVTRERRMDKTHSP